jgi:hypothetical protein
MILLWLIACASFMVALMAWRQARRNATRLAQLTEMYWELRYQHGELRMRVQGTRDTAAPPAADAGGETSGDRGDSFIPLSSLKR